MGVMRLDGPRHNPDYLNVIVSEVVRIGGPQRDRLLKLGLCGLSDQHPIGTIFGEPLARCLHQIMPAALDNHEVSLLRVQPPFVDPKAI